MKFEDNKIIISKEDLEKMDTDTLLPLYEGIFNTFPTTIGKSEELLKEQLILSLLSGKELKDDLPEGAII